MIPLHNNIFRFIAYALVLATPYLQCDNLHPALPTPGTIIIKHDKAPCKKKKTYILGCDAGRYEVRIGIFALEKNRLTLMLEYKTPAKEIAPFSPDRATRFALYIKSVLNHVAEHHAICIQLAGFAAAGPTTASRDFIDDLHAPFAVSGTEIRKHTALKKTVVINDFEALGLGIEAIDASHITTVLAGTPREHGTKLIIGAGSGLGSGLMLWNEKTNSYLPSPLNYSFVDFSPQSELELAYNEYLKEHANNAWGKVLGSSFGIIGIYNFLHRPEISPYQYADYLEIFNQRAEDPACKAAVDMFMQLYIRLLRTAVYAQAPYAGLYITNSIAEQHPALFTDPAFKTEFLNTGDLANAGNKYLNDYLQQIPVYLIASPDLKLYGAAQYMIIEQKCDR